MDAQTKRAIDSLTQELLKTQSELATVKRASRRPQLGFSSIESGSLDVVDPETGRVRLRLGYQPDGSVGVVPEGGDPPPAPSVPIVAPAPVGLMVQWDGRLAHDLGLPSDFDHVSVHVSATSGFTPDASTFQGTIPRAGGVLPVVPLEVGITYYVLLVPVGTGGVEGAASVEASGVPEAVGGVPGPGSITETEIADDAVTSPKIRALAVEAHHIVAEAIEAGHITAGAVTASKLAAEIVLASRLIAGNPGADRAEIDNHGIKVYNAEGELILTTEGGNLTLTGNIVGSQISGSRFAIATTAGTSAVIDEAPGGVVRTRMDSASGAVAQLQSSSTQAEFSVWGNVTDPATPSGGVVAVPGGVQLSLYSNAGSSTTNPRVLLTASPGRADGMWRGGDGSEVRIRALEGWSSVDALPPQSTMGEPPTTSGFLYAFRRTPTDAPTLSLQSPLTASGPGAGRRSIIHVEGATTARPSTVINHAARTHYLQGELVDGATDTTTDGRVELAATHSILAPRHAPVRTDMAAQPTATGTGDWIAFTTGQMPARTFTTGWSGRVRITIQMCGYNNNTTGATIALGFRLAGGSTVPVALDRAAMVRSMGVGGPAFGRQACQVIYLDLAGAASYTLTPMWRTSSTQPWSSAQGFDLGYQNSIIIEPLT